MCCRNATDAGGASRARPVGSAQRGAQLLHRLDDALAGLAVVPDHLELLDDLAGACFLLDLLVDEPVEEVLGRVVLLLDGQVSGTD